MVFPIVIYGWESWTIKKTEHWRIDAFELFCWRRLLRVLWTARRSNQSILKEISPRCPLKGLMLKLKLQYFGHLVRRADSFFQMRPWCWERLKVGEGDDRGWDGWMSSPTQWTWIWVSSGSWWWTGRPGVLRFIGSQRVRLSNWTELNWFVISVVSDSLWPHGLYHPRLLSPWNSPGKNTGVGWHSLLQGIFPIQRVYLGVLHCRQSLYCLSHQGSSGIKVTM